MSRQYTEWLEQKVADLREENKELKEEKIKLEHKIAQYINEVEKYKLELVFMKESEL